MADIVDEPLEDPFDAIVDAPFDAALSERYLIYAMSTITARSLPDLRDGLKPVHRRLLWAMRLLKLDPASGYKKCARVVGDVESDREAELARGKATPQNDHHRRDDRRADDRTCQQRHHRALAKTELY